MLLQLQTHFSVQPYELEALCHLIEEFGASLRNAPEHVGGGVAMLRLVRDPLETVKRTHTMMIARSMFNSDAKAVHIYELGLSQHTLPFTDLMHAATYHTNEWMGEDVYARQLV